MALLEAEGITKRYGGLLANDAVGMTLAPGEVRGLIGPNGAGKTTLVNVLSGIETPDAGRVRLAGADVTGLSPSSIAAKGLVRTFQVARVFPDMNVEDNVLVPFLAAGSPGGVATGRQRAAELLAAATLLHLAREPAGVLSGGQRMLLQVCAGLMFPSARVHVLDEPFAGINPVVKDTMIALIERENVSNRRAFLIVSHEMTVVRRLCPRVLVMIQGRIAAEGSLDEVARLPEVVRAYLGGAAQ
jgi:ABC-type branched-subunit amino acid transport system ATPase component